MYDRPPAGLLMNVNCRAETGHHRFNGAPAVRLAAPWEAALWEAALRQAALRQAVRQAAFRQDFPSPVTRRLATAENSLYVFPPSTAVDPAGSTGR